MESAIKTQYDFKDQLSRSQINFKKTPKQRLNISYVETRLESLDDLWSDIKKTHKAIVSFATSDIKLKEKYFVDNIFELLEEEYTEYKSCLKELLSNLTSTCHQSASNTTNNSNSSIKPPIFKLPDVRLPVYSGKYTEWATFRDLFLSLVHRNESLDNVQKLHYLKVYTAGEAEQLLRHIPTTDANYAKCWELLEQRYNNKRYLSTCLLKRLFSQRNLTSQTASGIKELLDTTKDVMSALSNLGVSVNSWDILIIYIISMKLDAETRKQWEIKVSETNDDLPTFAQFEEFMVSRFRALEFLEPSKTTFNSSNKNHSNNPKVLHASSVSNSCKFCSEKHKMFQCPKFNQADYDTRYNFVQNNRLCFNCLGSNHSVKQCLLKTSCRICNRKHHSLLHQPKPTTPDSVSHTVESSHSVPTNNTTTLTTRVKVPNVVTSCFSQGRSPSQILLATALVRVESRDGTYQILRAMIDQGSQTSFVTESAVQLLGLKRVWLSNTVHVSGLGNSKDLCSKYMVEFNLHSVHHSTFTVQVRALVLPKLTAVLPARNLKIKNWPEIDNLMLADPNYHIPNKIDILLGNEVFGKIILEGVIKSPTEDLVAQQSNLGWILSGVVELNSASYHSTVVSMVSQVDDNQFLRRFWELESEPSVTKTKFLTTEEERCEELFATTTRRDSEGRYIVKLPFRDEDPASKYGESRDIAVRRFKSQEIRLMKNPNLKQEYDKAIKEYLLMGHMRMITEEKDLKNLNSVYLPHHDVVRDGGPTTTTKVRPVFDASCKGTNGRSLNDDLMVGPRLQSDLRHLVMRFRRGPVCLVADIVKMYRMVKVDEDDCNFQRLVWREDPETEIKDYMLLRVTFGLSSSPYLAVKSLQQLALDEGQEFPLAANRILKDFYMDDLMTTCENGAEALEIYNQLNKIMQKGGFQLQKWSSNSETVMENINEKILPVDSLPIVIDDVMKILGLTWKKSSDTFTYSVSLPPPKTPMTKRRVVSDISRLFDPLGWISPCIITAKIMIQKLWLSGIAWDEELPSSLLQEWITYRMELENLRGFQLPRWTGENSSTKTEIHGFSDASTSAYAAVVYLRVTDAEGNIHVNLFSSKTKVAPVKQISVPRLELCGATLLSQLLKEVSHILEVPDAQVFAWTDSTIVLAWLRCHPSKWKTFVANRVSEISTNHPSNQWSHVQSADNPADPASRGLNPTALKNNDLWLHGPHWLREPNIQLTRPDIETNLEVRTLTAMIKEPMWSRFSSLTRMIRVIAYCRRMLPSKNRKSNLPKQPYLTSEELDEALEVCIRQSQWEEFGPEIQDLKNRIIKKGSKLYSLTPYLDEKGILRVRGRIDHAMLPDAMKHPIILSGKSHFSRLLVSEAHTKTMHGGPQLILTYLRTKYWITGVKNLAKVQYRKCVTCTRFKAAENNQFMGQLPTARTNISRPFSNSGVDFAGPINLRVSKGRGHKSYKAYICVFVCMATRAIHLEAVSDLTTQGFLSAFKRFVARRGHCNQIWSDNGTNFVGASRELRVLFADERSTISTELAEWLSNNGTTWHFIPPQAPHFGGLWEAGVKSTKYHLKRVLGDSTLTYEEMATVLSQIEACLNSRPIAQASISDNPHDPIPLTPGHFLVGEPLVIPPDRNFEHSTITTLSRWQMTQRMVQHFWRRWSREYLTQLCQRYKWAKVKPEPNIGDVVLVKDDNLPPAKWLYGIIVEKHPGSDGLTRVVTLRYKNTIIKRPVTKLCTLPI